MESLALVLISTLVAVTEVDFDRAAQAPATDPAQLLADALREAHGDPLDITAGSCGSISDSDLRYYCNGSCGSISDSDLRYFCNGSCGSISNNDMRYFCNKSCGSISNNDLRYFCGNGKKYPYAR